MKLSSFSAWLNKLDLEEREVLFRDDWERQPTDHVAMFGIASIVTDNWWAGPKPLKWAANPAEDWVYWASNLYLVGETTPLHSLKGDVLSASAVNAAPPYEELLSLPRRNSGL
jgi:hypothetical protein